MSAYTNQALADHTRNVQICAEIGGIAERNSCYTAAITCLIASTGKPIEQLTIGELLKLHNEHLAKYNHVPGATS